MKKLFITALSISSCISVSAQVLQIPFELFDNEHMVIKLPIAGSNDSVTYVFDSGASSTLLDSTKAAQCGFIVTTKTQISGASGNTSYSLSQGQKLYLGNQLYLTDVSVAITDISPLSKMIGFPFDGIIGADIMKNYYTHIDFDKKIMSLYDHNQPLNTKGYSVIPFTFKNDITIPQFPLSITLSNGETVTGDVFFDSGAGLSLLINTPFNKEHQISKKIGEVNTNKAAGLTGTTTNESGVLKQINIGDYTFEHLPLFLSSDTVGVASYEDYLGILGNQVINRFNFILDYKEKKIYLKPNSNFNAEFVFNRTPFNLSFSGKEIVVSSVKEDSDAYRSGLRKGYKVLSINGKSSNKIKSINKTLGTENREVKIEYLDQNNKKKTIKTKLEIT